jgi:PGF-CTERM protein
MWNNSDENIEVCKSVDPYSVALGNEEEVTVYLGLCVDPKHIIKGTKVENISVIDTLHSQFTIVDGSFSEEPKYDPKKNPDGTTTIRWNISSLCCEEWRVSFNVTVAFALPIDVTESYGVSKVIYDDPDSEETKAVRKLPIPAGKLLFVLPTPTPTPTTTSSPTPEPPGFEALLAIAGLLAVAYMMWRRKR